LIILESVTARMPPERRSPARSVGGGPDDGGCAGGRPALCVRGRDAGTGVMPGHGIDSFSPTSFQSGTPFARRFWPDHIRRFLELARHTLPVVWWAFFVPAGTLFASMTVGWGEPER
jgi:hypothetical protein